MSTQVTGGLTSLSAVSLWSDMYLCGGGKVAVYLHFLIESGSLLIYILLHVVLYGVWYSKIQIRTKADSFPHIYTSHCVEYHVYAHPLMMFTHPVLHPLKMHKVLVLGC